MKTRMIVLGLAAAAALLIPASPAFAPCHIVEFEPSSYSVGESVGKVTLTVTNNGGQQIQDMNVDYHTANGSAKAPGDYTAESGTVTFQQGGSGEATIDVPIKNDTGDEPNETFTVVLENVRPSGSCVSEPRITGPTATVTITDNDPKPKPTTSAVPTRASSPRATTSASPMRSPTRTASASPSPTRSATPTPTKTSVAVGDEGDGGLSGGAVGGIVAAAVVVGGAAVVLVRRRFLT